MSCPVPAVNIIDTKEGYTYFSKTISLLGHVCASPTLPGNNRYTSGLLVSMLEIKTCTLHVPVPASRNYTKESYKSKRFPFQSMFARLLHLHKYTRYIYV